MGEFTDKSLLPHTMGWLHFDRLSVAWKGEATDFTPLLSERLDQLGESLGVDLASIGQTEVTTAGGRRIDIVAGDSEGAVFVIENQYGKADHDHLTRGLAYAVAAHAKGLIVVAEEHRDEFRAVAEYLNDLADNDTERGISVWLVEARAVRVDESPWAPLFTSVVSPNRFVANVETAMKATTTPVSFESFWEQYSSSTLRKAATAVFDRWIEEENHDYRLRPNRLQLRALAPSVNGSRSVVSLFPDGRVQVPFGAYDGDNSGIPILELGTTEFRARANELFGFRGGERIPSTVAGWLTQERVEPLLVYCIEVASAYADALAIADA